MAKKSKKLSKREEAQRKLNKAWNRAVRNFNKRLLTVEAHGYEVTSQIKRPERVKQSDINWLNKQLISRGKPEKTKSTRLLNISYEEVPPDIRESYIADIKRKTESKDTKLRKQLLSEGFNEESIDYFLNEEQMSMTEVAEELRAGAAESERIQQAEEIAQTEINGYYYDPETGETFSPNDPRIIERKRRGGWETKWDAEQQRFVPKIKSNLEFHSEEALTPKQLEELQWSNFIGNFEVAEQFGNLDMKAASYYRELRDKIGQAELFRLLNDASDFSSNIGDISWWYESTQKDQIDKMQSLISLAQRTTGQDLTNLSRELSDYADTLDGSSGYSIGGETRQQNRAYRHRLR